MIPKKLIHQTRLTFVNLSILITCLTFSVWLNAQTKDANIIYPTTTIYPFELPEGEPINFPLYQATPVGDINGDGFTDMLYKDYVGDERTPSMTDNTRKSVIITEPGINPEGIVFYNADFYGIGDYNGDGYDDVLDIDQKKIRFGCAAGISNDSLVISYPDELYKFLMAGDINNDGYSEFIIYGTINYSYTSLCFSGPDANAISVDPSEGKYYISDYDNDGETEICFAQSFFENGYQFDWYRLDKANNQFIHELSHRPAWQHDPSTHYPVSFCDINGDQLIDLAYAYYIGDTIENFNLSVYFGLPEAPYFEDAIDIEVRAKSRMFYDAGDFNGDGFDDWYASYSDDSIAVYYGRSDVAVNGFQKELVYTGANQQLLLKSQYFDEFAHKAEMEDFDYNQDGISDIFFNFLSYDEHLRFDTVGTAIVMGGQSPDFNNPLVLGKTGNRKFGNIAYGEFTKNLGDINKDGYNDWGVLAQSGCYLEIFYGGAEFNFEPDISFMLPQTARANCWDWSFGDLNGDSWTDIAISNSSNREFGFVKDLMTLRSDVYIFYGEENMQAVYHYDDTNVTLNNDTFWEYGYNLSIVGDYNADGFDDLVVGGSTKLYNQSTELLIYFGSDTEIEPEPDLIINELENHFYTGQPITACGDVNGDDYVDFTFGYDLIPGGSSLVYFGGPNADTEYDLILASTDPNSINLGENTPRNAGDFDGDGYNDLVQYCYATHEIYIYKGGPDLDSIADYVIANPGFPPACYSLEFIAPSSETGASDLSACFGMNDCYDFRIFSLESVSTGEEKYLLKNCLGPSGSSIASGDFNGDDITEIFAGVSYELNYGVPGGVVYFYEPTLFTNVDDAFNSAASDEVVKIYPNPAHGMLYLESKEIIGHIDIYNHTGQLVFGEKMASNSHSLNVNTLKPGLYFARITTSSGSITKPVMIR